MSVEFGELAVRGQLRAAPGSAFALVFYLGILLFMILSTATPVSAHELTRGVGTQTQFSELSLDSIVFDLNLGFSDSPKRSRRRTATREPYVPLPGL